MMLAQRSKNRSLKERISALEKQCDDALSKLVDTHVVIVELTLENERLRSQLPKNKVFRL